MKVLTLGDGNFSFSLAYCRDLLQSATGGQEALGNEKTGKKRRRRLKLKDIATEVTASSVDSRQEILLKYR